MDMDYKEHRRHEYELKRNHCIQSFKNTLNNNHKHRDKEEIYNFNYKKTNAYKFLFSCGGYGGRCNMCKLE